MSTLQNLINELQNIDALKQQVEDLNARVAELEDENSSLADERDQAEATLDDAEGRIAELEEELYSKDCCEGECDSTPPVCSEEEAKAETKTETSELGGRLRGLGVSADEIAAVDGIVGALARALGVKLVGVAAIKL